MANGMIFPSMQSIGLGPGQGGKELTSSNDLDNIVDSGVYFWAASAPSNNPNNSTPYCGVYVIHGGTNLKQVVFRGTYGSNPADPAEWTRYKFGGNAWTAWTKTV